MIGLVPFLGAVLVRKIVLGDQLPLLSTGEWYIGLSYNFEKITEALRRPSPIGWPMLLLAMMVFPWLVFLNQRSAKAFRIRVTIAFLAIFAITAVIAVDSEVRIFYSVCGITNWVCCCSIQRTTAFISRCNVSSKTLVAKTISPS
jgi:hypothetical protein